MDPETGLDAVRDVGIRGDTIARISADPLAGARVIDARGLVVAPGFIDLHQHQQDAAAYRLKAMDGVTTALELEIGVPDLARFLREREGRSLIHHGASASHPAARVALMGAPPPPGPVVPPAGPATDTAASPEQVARIRETLGAEGLSAAPGTATGTPPTP